MKKKILFLVFIAMSMILSVSAEAAEKRLALVIGNSEYKNSPLKNSANDASDMEKMLGQLGFEVISKINAGHQDMEDAIRQFGKKIRRANVGLFYFSGHGIQHNGENYLLPVDADVDKETDLKYKAVNAGMVLDEMNHPGNRVIIVILDACRNNPFPRTVRSPQLGLAQMNAPSGMLIAYSTSPNSVASDGVSRNGTYTENLLKYMVTPGLTIEQMFKKVRIGVLQDTNNQQRPWESVSITDDFYFVSNSASVPEPPKPLPPVEKPVAALRPADPVQIVKSGLRKEPMNILSEQAGDFFKLDKELRPTSYMKNEFKDNGDGTITDHATGLMWQKSGIDDITYQQAESYVKEMNQKKFAGYDDWRMPTVDELKSLLKAEKESTGLYISLMFDSRQKSCWTSDQYPGSTYYAWLVNFSSGCVLYNGKSSNYDARLARSLQK